jgi:hypothetical protein
VFLYAAGSAAACAVCGEMISPVSGSTISMVDDASALVRIQELRWWRRDLIRSGTRIIVLARMHVYRIVSGWPWRRIHSAINTRNSVPIIIRTANAIMTGRRLA